jgi:hypothetical protein
MAPMAGLGWLELISGRETWRGRFQLDSRGLGFALLFYLVVILVLIVGSGLIAGALPSYPDIFWVVVVNALPVALLGLCFYLTTVALRVDVPLLVYLVPTTYALAFLLVLSFLLGLLGGSFGPAVLGMLAYMMYRLARLGAGLGIATSIAFAALCVVALVALQLGLYTMTAPPPA